MKHSLLKKIIGGLAWMTAFPWAITPLYRPANKLPERHRSQLLTTSIINKTKSHIKIAINATSTQGRSTIVRAANTLLRSGQQMPFEDFTTEALIQGASFTFANKTLEKLRLKGLITLVITAGKDAQGKSIITIEETNKK
jgi:hypothetical protein